MKDCTFNIEKHIATLSGNEGEVTKQINLVSWNGKPAVFDVRAWSTQGKPYKGVTLTLDEVKAFKAAFDGLEP